MEEEKEILLNSRKLHGNKNSAPSDEQMGMAIMNLQAMLNIEDMDQVIKLLEQNNWSETDAANTYYAQQANHGAHQNQANADLNEEYQNNHGVRAPIQQQEDQLIGGSPFDDLFFGGMRQQLQQPRAYSHNLPANQRANSYQEDALVRENRSAHVRGGYRQPNGRLGAGRLIGLPRPRDFSFQIESPYDNPEELQYDYGQNSQSARRRRVNSIQQQRSWTEYFGSIIKVVWSAIKWTFTLGGNIGSVGNEQNDFDCGPSILNDERILAALELERDQQFFQLCLKSRAQKKPILFVVMMNPEDQNQTDKLIQKFVEDSPLINWTIKQRYNLMLISQEQMETHLINSQQYFRVHPADDINAFVLFVRNNFKISIMTRITEETINSQNKFHETLQEYAGLFDVMAEEDPGYRQIQMFQDAGIIPIIPNDNYGGYQNDGRRPAGVSANIPQEAIDEMMREHSLEQQPAKQYQYNQVQQPADSIEEQPLSEQINSARSIRQDPKKVEVPKKIINLPQEAPDNDTNAIKLVFRMPLTGERIQRNFLKTDKVQLMYDFVDHLQNENKCKFEDGVNTYTDQYQIMQNMPRKIYDDKNKTFEDVGLYPRGAILQIQQITQGDSD